MNGFPSTNSSRLRYAKFRAYGHFVEKAARGGLGPRPLIIVKWAAQWTFLISSPNAVSLNVSSIFKSVWGGRKLEDLYKKRLPPEVPIGESWEIADRPEAMSVIAHGPLAGHNLRWLMEHHRPELLGAGKTWPERFPLLVKILDARDRLSLQVHPPAHKARQLRGEPKTEMWYITQAAPGAELLAGLKRGVTRSGFERKLRNGTGGDCIHRLPVQAATPCFAERPGA